MAYFRDRGLSLRRKRALVLEVLDELGSIQSDEVEELCGETSDDARKLMEGLIEEGLVRQDGEKYVRVVGAENS